MSCAQVKGLPEMRKSILLSTHAFFDMSSDCNKDHSSILSTLHIQKGTFYLLRMIQRVHFSTEYTTLQRKQPICSSSSLFSLSPFLDDFGLLRVGGRLKNAGLDFNSRHPILLPKRHPLTVSIINYFHKKLLHAGPQALLASIRLHYWPIGGRKTVSYVVNKCIVCFRCRPRLMEHIMADFPKERVQAARAFLTTGVDFCGPFYYNAEVRNRPPTKCYICIFICFATKAIHMELAKDLSTSAFLAALQRFVSLRGKPKTIWSDHATNFVGANNELAELKQLFLNNNHQRMVRQQCLDDGIGWKFIPPRSPHFGGIWEAAIKSAKYHFNRVVGSSILTAHR
ncbi:uncharacterized protein LOC118750132 [Rhagoletis pomonella]|uniref:uncharacterized protein LOC118750132 n=1 Tax=Rhagoletis pomonella TaxID=28610 RepID=UPI00177C8129|nr:uncharacterized protein LOC118750132 [Rhagoletis pomonella]